MRERGDSDGWILLGLLAAMALAAFVMWWFSRLLGLDFATGTRVFSGLIALLGAGYFIWKVELLEPGALIWLMFAGLWVCFWPALSYWGAASYPSSMRGGDIAVTWWSGAYVKWGVLAATLAIGYRLRMRRKRFYGRTLQKARRPPA